MVLRNFIKISLVFGAWVHAVDYEADVVIYGGTSAAITAAVQVKKWEKATSGFSRSTPGRSVKQWFGLD